MKVYLIPLMILFFPFQDFIKKDKTNQKINGIINNYYDNKPIVFVGVDLYINDTLTISTISDFDGRFVFNLYNKVINSDFINLEFKYANNFSKRILLTNTKLTDLKITLKTDTNITMQDIQTWRNLKRLEIKECGTNDESEFKQEFEFDLKYIAK